MQSSVRRRQTVDLSSHLECRSAVKTGVAEDACSLVVAEIDGGFVSRVELSEHSVTVVGPRSRCELDVVVEWDWS